MNDKEMIPHHFNQNFQQSPRESAENEQDKEFDNPANSSCNESPMLRVFTLTSKLSEWSILINYSIIYTNWYIKLAKLLTNADNW